MIRSLICRIKDSHRVERNYKIETLGEKERMPTRRESIAELLTQTEMPLTAREIAMLLGLKSRAIVYEDLQHIALSARRRDKELVSVPASCGKCEFVFKGRTSMKKPSKCPKCRSEWIFEASYIIRAAKR
jgi:predicted Zn-ribbon and HTH transcriptional regulator